MAADTQLSAAINVNPVAVAPGHGLRVGQVGVLVGEHLLAGVDVVEGEQLAAQLPAGGRFVQALPVGDEEVPQGGLEPRGQLVAVR